MNKVCQNCGRYHDSRLVETHIDGDGKEIEVIICEHPRYEDNDYLKNSRWDFNNVSN